MIAWWSSTFLSLTTRPERQLVERGHVLGAAPVAGVVADQLGGRLDLGDHVAGQEARVGARVGERLVLLVEALRGRQRAARREAEQRVGVALERGQVVEELRLLALLLLLELRDLAGPGRSSASTIALRLVLGGQPLAAQVAAGVEALAGGGEARLDEPVGLGHEGADLLLAARDQRQRRRLHAAERDRAVERRAQPDRRGAGGVHAHDPVGLGARARRPPRAASSPRPGAAARRPRSIAFLVIDDSHSRCTGFVHRGDLVQVGEDQLALAPGVAGVDDRSRSRRRPSAGGSRFSCFVGPLVVGDELELLRAGSAGRRSATSSASGRRRRARPGRRGGPTAQVTT